MPVLRPVSVNEPVAFVVAVLVKPESVLTPCTVTPAKAWLKEVGVTRLAYYADPNAKVFQDLKVAGKALGMPTTLLLDGAGCELGNMGGPAEWASEDALKLLGAALKK